jgi:hypothetical protein
VNREPEKLSFLEKLVGPQAAPNKLLNEKHFVNPSYVLREGAKEVLAICFPLAV